MEIREIENKEEWENFLQTCAEKSFLHSWSWGEFNRAMSSPSTNFEVGSVKDNNVTEENPKLVGGKKIWRFGIYQGDNLMSVALVIKVSAMRGTFLFVPHGPVVSESLGIKDKKEILQLLLTEIENIVKEEKASFVRISPIWERTEENINIFKDSIAKEAPIHMHPEVTWELDITLLKEDLLMDMRKTTRYLIRQAEKNPDIQIIRSNKPEDLKFFWPVYSETAKRHYFAVFSEKYLQTEFDIFSKDSEVLLFLGKYKGEIVSAAIFIFWQVTCFYHPSGSLSKYNKIPVSYLLQWEAIKEAKNRGCKTYNFWGIAPISPSAEIGNPKSQNYKNMIVDSLDKNHPWYGLSLFKIGFGGYKREYVKTQDFIISKKYWLNYIIEKIRKRKRGL